MTGLPCVPPQALSVTKMRFSTPCSSIPRRPRCGRPGQIVPFSNPVEQAQRPRQFRTPVSRNGVRLAFVPKKKTRPTRSRVVYKIDVTRSPAIRHVVAPGGIRELMAAEVKCRKLPPEVPTCSEGTALRRGNGHPGASRSIHPGRRRSAACAARGGDGSALAPAATRTAMEPSPAVIASIRWNENIGVDHPLQLYKERRVASFDRAVLGSQVQYAKRL